MDIENRSKTLLERKQPTALNPQPANHYKLTVKNATRSLFVGSTKNNAAALSKGLQQKIAQQTQHKRNSFKT